METVETIDKTEIALKVQGIQDSIIQNVSALKEERGIKNIEALAEVCNINRATAYNVMQKDPSKRKNTKLATIVALAMGLGVDILYLLTEREGGNG